MDLSVLAASPIVQGAINGAVSAGAVDFQAFRNWKCFDDAAEYAWGVAAWRWFQGAVVGAVGGLAWNAMVS